MILNASEPASLKVAGRYSRLHWEDWLTLEGDVGFSIAGGGTQVLLYQRHAVMADVKQLRRFSRP